MTHAGDCHFFFFFFKATATTEIYTLSLHDALPICVTNEPMKGEPQDQQPQPNDDDIGDIDDE